MNKTLRHAVTLLLAGLVLVLGASAASADNGPIKLEVTGDGGHNVNVVATWKNGKPVEEIVEATLTAKSADGRSFGPVRLMSASEGQNVYQPAEPLPNGEWNVTVTATKPSKAQAKTKVTAQDLAASPMAAAEAATRDRVAAADSDDSTDSLLKIGVIVLVAVLALGAFAVIMRRRGLYARR
ncbi:hypothetical protein OG320_08525 [Microbispora sp. NBC_01189]|uniref:hypothetical protein n=1 Tax=Microbispora sp. NBC_01189 TaxID=2903583 RepID=UPI002E12873A|nr:hypothetical protein OG320_08525 [Microbispora sp. NBC_01189]